MKTSTLVLLSFWFFFSNLNILPEPIRKLSARANILFFSGDDLRPEVGC